MLCFGTGQAVRDRGCAPCRPISAAIGHLLMLVVATVIALEFGPGRAGAVCPTDLTGDGTTNGMDLAHVLGSWTGPGVLNPCSPLATVDLNHDCHVNGLDLAIVLGGWGPCAPTCSDLFQPMSFAAQVVQTQFPWGVVQVIINGNLSVTPDGFVDGQVQFQFVDGFQVLMMVNHTATTFITVGTMMDFQPGIASTVLVNGKPRPVPELIDHFVAQASSGAPPGAWSGTSRISAAIMALAQTQQLECHAHAENIFCKVNGGGVAASSPSWGCKIAAYGAAAIIAGLAAAGCAVLAAGCAVGTTVTIGGLAVPCTFLIGLCGAGGFVGTVVAYEGVLALWQGC